MPTVPATLRRTTRGHRRRALAALAAVCAVASVSACTSTIDGQAHLASGAVAKKVTSDAFTTLLLSPNDLAAAIGAPTLTLDGDLTDPAQAQSLSDAHCSGAGWLMLGDVYHGTGYLQVHWGRWSAPQPTYVLAFQGVALYPTSLKANDFLTQSKKTWSECAGKSVSRQFKDGNDVFTLGTPPPTTARSPWSISSRVAVAQDAPTR